jgi:hypothetical protein
VPGLGIVSDPVEHVGRCSLVSGQQPLAIDLGDHFAAGSLDLHYLIRLPDVREYVLPNALELVEAKHRGAVFSDLDAAQDPKALWVAKGER